MERVDGGELPGARREVWVGASRGSAEDIWAPLGLAPPRVFLSLSRVVRGSQAQSKIPIYRGARLAASCLDPRSPRQAGICDFTAARHGRPSAQPKAVADPAATSPLGWSQKSELAPNTLPNPEGRVSREASFRNTLPLREGRSG